MSWDEERSERVCFCGKGKIISVYRLDDWGRSDSYEYLECPICSNEYFYDNSSFLHSGNMETRGWIPIRVYGDEKRQELENKAHRQLLLQKAKERYLDTWISRFEKVKSKKEIWIILTNKGKYYPAESTFYRQTKNFNELQMRKYIEDRFIYYHLGQIFTICKIVPDWEYLGANEEDIKNLTPTDS